ncbi:hypothetical protein M885DRAFT_516504 [Pelagophyceae sp. CCMP2097]|nr:hypothetical protein M885DRAFT_516504 [Pelagophyceae sp. CCMP2097]
MADEEAGCVCCPGNLGFFRGVCCPGNPFFRSVCCPGDPGFFRGVCCPGNPGFFFYCPCCFERWCWVSTATVGWIFFSCAVGFLIAAHTLSNNTYLVTTLGLVVPVAFVLALSGWCCLCFCKLQRDDVKAPPATVECAQVQAHSSWAEPIQDFAQPPAWQPAWQGAITLQPGAQPPAPPAPQQARPALPAPPPGLQAAGASPQKPRDVGKRWLGGNSTRIAPDVFSVEAFVDLVRRAGRKPRRDAARAALEGRPPPRRAEDVAAALNAFSLSFDVLDIADGIADVIRLDAETVARIVRSLDAVRCDAVRNVDAREECAARLARDMAPDDKLRLAGLIPEYAARLGLAGSQPAADRSQPQLAHSHSHKFATWIVSLPAAPMDASAQSASGDGAPWAGDSSASSAVGFAGPVSLERARLLERLQDFGLVEHSVEGDGACQFRALAHQLFGDQGKHAVVRHAVVQQLRCAPDTYQNFVHENFEAYALRMAQPREWGDHVTLQATADAYRIKITVVTSYAERSFIRVKPTLYGDADGCASPSRRHPCTRARRNIWLAFWAETHYSSIEPSNAPATPQTAKAHRSLSLSAGIKAAEAAAAVAAAAVAAPVVDAAAVAAPTEFHEGILV